MNIILRILTAIPCIPAIGGPLKNRRNATAKVCAPADISINISDSYWAWLNRVPRSAQLMRDRRGRHVGSINRKP